MGLFLRATLGRRAGGGGCCPLPVLLLPVDVTKTPTLSVEGPQLVPSRILVVLAEEVKVGGAQGVQRPHVDQDLRLLAGKAKPAKVTVCDYSHLSPSIEGMLSSPDLAGKLCPVVAAGIPPPVGPVGPVGLCGMTSPSDLTSIGPVVPGSDPVGLVGPYIACELKAWRGYCASIYRIRTDWCA